MDESQRETIASGQGVPTDALDRWGPFERLQRVGQGSFGEVYRAFDPTLQRHVALKLLLPSGLPKADDAELLLQEARAMARVRHPNIVPIYGVGTHEGRVGFWSDFVRGHTLADLLVSQGPFGPHEAAGIGLDVCKAVGAVHATGLVHRDIKAGNIMREEGGRILLLDFGLTHERGIPQRPSGTPAYMAPELLRGEPATISTDVYAVGVLLFNLLTAQYPLAGADLAELRSGHVSGAYRTVIDLRPDLPESLAQVVQKAIAASPSQRYASTGLLIAALANANGMRPALTADLTVRPTHENYRRAHDLLARYYRPQSLETAIALLEGVVAQDAGFAPAWADLAHANYLQFEQHRDAKFIQPAREAALRALAIAPNLSSAHAALGAIYAATGQSDLAIYELDEAHRLDKFNVAVYAARVGVYKRQGRDELVEPTLQGAIALAPGDWRLLTLLGEHYLDVGQWDAAGQQYRRALELVPDNPRAHNNLGLVFRGLGKLAESAASFQQAIALEPTPLRFRNLGMVLAEAGRYPEAKLALEESIEMSPTQYRAWGLLASVYSNQGEDSARVTETYLKAIDLAADLLRETSRDAYLLAAIGGYHAALRNDTEALPLLAQAAALASDTPDVLYQVAVGYERLQRRDEALDYLGKALTQGYAAAVIARDPALAELRRDERYAAVAANP